MKVELFHHPGCARCRTLHADLRAAARKVLPSLDWHEVDAAKELDHLLEVGVLSLPAIAIDGEIAFLSLPTPSQLAQELQRRMPGSGAR